MLQLKETGHEKRKRHDDHWRQTHTKNKEVTAIKKYLRKLSIEIFTSQILFEKRLKTGY